MKVNIKKLHPDAVIPKYGKLGDCGMDLTAISRFFDEFGNVVYGTGLAIEIPEGYVGLLFPRSSNCKKHLILSNSIGVIDSGYRGEIILKFRPSGVFYDDVYAEEGTLGSNSDTFETIVFPIEKFEMEPEIYAIGERIAQIVILPYPQIEFNEVSELSSTERGSGGFGSTGK